MSPERAKFVAEIAEKLRRGVREHLLTNATFEQESDASFDIMRDVLWNNEDARLRESITDAE